MQPLCPQYLRSRRDFVHRSERRQDPPHVKEVTLSTLERAIVIAAEAHTKKIDKGGAPYILHPLRGMLAMTDTDSRIVAVLHDVVEDHSPPWTLEKIRSEGFSETVLEAL